MKKCIKLILTILSILFCTVLAIEIIISFKHPSSSPLETLPKSSEVLSPFTQFQNIKKEEIGVNGRQVDEVLKSYGIYDKILQKVGNDVYTDSSYYDVKISGFNVGNKKVAVLLIDKGHLYIYLMFSNSGGKWTVDGFASQSEREKPEYRVEQSNDGVRYWLVVKHEANHGTGLNLYDEIWYNPDGSIAAEYPLEGSALLLPQVIEPEANANFTTSAYYDGGSTISLSYSVSLIYNYKDGFQSVYSPVIRDNWEYDLETKQLKFVSWNPALPEGLGTMKHEVSADYGVLQGYIDFYKTRFENKKITTLAEWERFIELK